MSRLCLLPFAALLVCARAYEGPARMSAGIAGEENGTVIGEIFSPFQVCCPAYGCPPPSVKWYRSNKGNTLLYNDTVYEPKENVLLIRKLEIDYLGLYTCEANNGVGHPVSRKVVVRAYKIEGHFDDNEFLVSRDTQPSVLWTQCLTTAETTTTTNFRTIKLPRPVTGPARMSAGIAGEENGTVIGEIFSPFQVCCPAYGCPPPSVKWYRSNKGNTLLYNDTVYEPRENVLLFRKLEIDYLGLYTCEANNGVGQPVSRKVVVRAYKIEGHFDDNEFLVSRETKPSVLWTQCLTTAETTTTTNLRTTETPRLDTGIKEVHDCDEYVANCSRLRCEYGVQRARLPDGCEKCSCVQVEIDCEPLRQECNQLKCNYEFERIVGADGCERCVCIEYPCQLMSCGAGERCVVQQYVNHLKPESKFAAECRTIVKAGACPMHETTTNNLTCPNVRKCGDDADCRGVGKCCRRGCSYLCVTPVEQRGGDCKRFMLKCGRLQYFCRFGIVKITNTDGCKRCKCNQDPCKKTSCPAGKRCVVKKTMALQVPNDQTGVSDPLTYFAVCETELVVPAKCTDNPFFADCSLIVRSKFCRHSYYSKFCCKSCVEAGQLDPQEVELQADQPYRKK